jgi:hypothetical protein
MPATRKRPGHYYSVYVGLCVSEEVKRRVESASEDFSQPDRVLARSFYRGSSQALAERAFFKACVYAANTPLAFETVFKRDSEILLRIQAGQFYLP